MAKGKYANGKHLNVKSIAMLLAVILLVGTAMGGTLAWLTDKTNTKENTFTVGDIDIDLTESNNLDLKMIPGKTLTKDPKVTVAANSEDAYVFVKVEESSNFDDFMTYGIAEGWTPLVDSDKDGFADDGVYYRNYTGVAAAEYSVLKDNQVKVKTAVTKANMNGLTEATYPTLTFTAYAIQSQYLTDQNKDDTVDALDAWALVNA